jgi:hypothetical protein
LEGESEIVEITTLDKELEGKSPVMIKVDVEGFETEVLRGAATTLATPALQCVLLELCGSGAAYGYDEEDVRRTMKHFGFQACVYHPFERQLVRGDAGTIFSNNALFVRDMAYVAERLATARPFLVLDKSI